MNRREFFKFGPAFPVAAVAVSLMVREDGKEPIEANVSVLRTKPGDIVVLRTSYQLNSEETARLYRTFEQAFPGLKAMVLDSTVTFEGVLRTT